MRTTRLTVTLVLASLLLSSCGGDEDLLTPVAQDVRGTRIDAGAETSPGAAAPVETATAEPSPSPEQPAVAPSVTEEPAAAPEPAPPAEQPGDAAEPAPEMPLGDVPTTADEPAPPLVEETAADPREEPLDLPEPDPDWKPEPVRPPVFRDGEWVVTFDYLGSFDVGMYAVDEASPLAQHTPKMPLPEKEEGAPEPEKGIPEAVRKMNGQKVRIEGYMIPLKFEDGKVKSFFLSRYMMGCCFGVLPKANEIIEVTMQGDTGAYYDAYMPFVVVGTFEIVEDGTEPEFLKSVFRMKGDSADYAEDW